jgi:short-subunit dehydrogenase
MASKTCVVVGGGPGLGLAVARRFGRNQYRIALISRRQETLAPLVATLQKEGIEARGYPADVHDHPALVRALSDIRHGFGPIDVLEYSPEPHTPPQNLREWMPLTMSLAEVHRRMSLSCIGAIVCANEVLPDMLARKSGTILITTSGSGVEPIKTLTPVGMSMAAARNYAHCLHDELKGKGVYAATVILSLLIAEGDKYGDPDVVAGHYWDAHVRRDQPEVNVVTPLDPHQHHVEDMKKYGVTIPTD